MLSDSAVHVAFIKSIISERRERIIQCKHCFDFFAKHISCQYAYLVKCLSCQMLRLSLFSKNFESCQQHYCYEHIKTDKTEQD